MTRVISFDGMSFGDPSELVQYLRTLDDQGITPQIAGYNCHGQPVIVWLYGVGRGFAVSAVILGVSPAGPPRMESRDLSRLHYPLDLYIPVAVELS